MVLHAFGKGIEWYAIICSRKVVFIITFADTHFVPATSVTQVVIVGVTLALEDLQHIC